MTDYIGYLKYILEHKKNVFIECWREGLYLHAFTHDLSKFHPKEFIPYARKFYGKGWLPKESYYGDIRNHYPYKYTQMGIDKAFDKGWQHHKDRNKHHWDYWHERSLVMPYEYVIQMVCDWRAMSKKFGGTPQEFYLENFNKIELGISTRLTLERILDLDFKHCCECDAEYWMNIRENIEDFISFKERHPDRYDDTLIREWIDRVNTKYNLDMLKLLGYKESEVYK